MVNTDRKHTSNTMAPKPAGQETETVRRKLETPRILLERIPAPPLDDEEYTLEAFGDISLSNIDFVPPPPTTLSPRKSTFGKPKLPQGSRSMRSGSLKRPAGFTHRLKAPSLSRARRINAAEMSFESLVASLKESRETEVLSDSLDANAASTASLSAAAARKRIMELKNLGGAAVISEGRSPITMAENGGYSPDCARRDENIVPPLKNEGKVHKRGPIPRWDVDSEVISRFKLV